MIKLLLKHWNELKGCRFRMEIIWKTAAILWILAYQIFLICFLLRFLLPMLSLKGMILCGGLFLLQLLLSFLLLRLFYRSFSRLVIRTDKRFVTMEKTNRSLTEINKRQPFAGVLEEYLEYFRNSVEREYSAKLLQKQAELDSMQSQINPHFLYNTLDSIRGQALEDGCPETAEMIESLSVLFRYTVGQRQDILTLAQEFKNVDHYIKIQQYRFRGRFEVKRKIEEDDRRVLSCLLPKLTLQPIIENAIYHGLENTWQGGEIVIEAYTTQSQLVITVSDNGEGMSSEQLKALNKKLLDNAHFTSKDSSSHRGSGMALVNVNARIKLLYGDHYGLIAYSTRDVGTKIEIVLPLLEGTDAKGTVTAELSQ